MDAPPCQNCGKRHWSWQKCGADSKAVKKPTPKLPSKTEIADEAVATYTALSTGEIKNRTRLEKRTVVELKSEQRRHGGARPGAGRKRSPLTKAERQKLYREKKRNVDVALRGAKD